MLWLVTTLKPFMFFLHYNLNLDWCSWTATLAGLKPAEKSLSVCTPLGGGGVWLCPKWDGQGRLQLIRPRISMAEILAEEVASLTGAGKVIRMPCLGCQAWNKKLVERAKRT